MRRGEVFVVTLDPTIGSEQRKQRPCVIVKRTIANEDANPITAVVPIADANGRPGNLLHVFVPAGTGGMIKDSRILCQQVRSIDKRRIVGEKLADMPEDVMRAVDAGLRAFLDL